MEEAYEYYQKGLEAKKEYLKRGELDFFIPKITMCTNFEHADRLGYADASFQLALFYSCDFKQPSVDIENREKEAYWLPYLVRADAFGHQDAAYDLAMYLLSRTGSSQLAYLQAEKVSKMGRANDYIPLIKYYKENNDDILPYYHRNKQIVYLNLKENLPKTMEEILNWDYAIEYASGLLLYGDFEQQMAIIPELFINKDKFDKKYHPDLAYLALMVSSKNGMNETVKVILNLMEEDSSLLKYPNQDLSLIYSIIKDYPNNPLMKGTIFYEKCHDRLNIPAPADEFSRLPDLSDESRRYDIPLYYIGICYLDGLGPIKNEKLGFFFLNKVYELDKYGHLFEKLGDCYYYGKGTSKDAKKALEIYRHHNYKREDQYANCLYLAKEYDLAFKKYNQLYKEKYQNNPPQWLIEGLGYMYYNGFGTPKDIQKAKECFEIAIKFNSAFDYNMLGLCCIDLGEETKNAAIFHFKKAYEIKPSFYIEYNIGRCYHYGYGVIPDLSEAKRWYELSYNHGHTAVKSILDKLKS